MKIILTSLVTLSLYLLLGKAIVDGVCSALQKKRPFKTWWGKFFSIIIAPIAITPYIIVVLAGNIYLELPEKFLSLLRRFSNRPD